MDATTAHRIFEWIERYPPKVVDITGGAPELSAFFQPLVKVSRGAGCRVIDRNNLTILEEPGFENLHDFLAEHEVEIIASLPCYEPENVHKQRGQGVFDKSIRGLLKLNSVGYGCGKLPLHLVYNPVGASLPGPQAALEEDYRKALKESHGVHFDRLLTLTNQPIARFAEDLRAQGQWEAYMELLTQAFNPDTLEGLMCRSTLNVGYQGDLFDCDFNQMLGLHLAEKTHLSLGSGSRALVQAAHHHRSPLPRLLGRCGQQLHRSPHRMNPAPDRVSTTRILVVGLGAVGSATLYQLALRGIACHGIDAHYPPHALGSSHGQTRITRLAVGEGAAYVPLGSTFSCHLALTGISGPNTLAAYLRWIGFWRQA